MNRHRTQGGPPRPTNPRLLGFTDRVMAGVATEPNPTAARALMHAALRLRLHDAAGALATAWHLAFGRTGPIPALVRAQSLLLLLVFTVLIGTGGTLAAAGAVHIVENPREPRQVDRPLVLPDTSPGPNAPHDPVVLVPPSPSPIREQDEKERESAVDDAPTGAGEGDQAREGRPKAGAGGDKGTPKNTTRQKKQSGSEAPPKPADPKQPGSDASQAGSSDGDRNRSTGTKPTVSSQATPKPRSDSEQATGGEADGTSGRGS